MPGLESHRDRSGVTTSAPHPASVLDAAFAAELAPEKLWAARLACSMATVLYAVFGIIDLWMIPSALHAVWIIRAVVVVASGWVLALTWHERFLDHYEKFALFIPVLWAAGIEAMLFFAAPGDPARHVYYAGLILVVIGFHTFIYLPILPMIAISAGIAAIYAYIGLAAHDMARLGDLPTLVANLFFLVSAVILCGAGQARRYRYLLENFRWRHTLARDVAAKEQARRQSEQQASHDLLTGIPNRRHFIYLVERSIEASRLQGTWTAVMFIDLDGFKPVNDTYGHAIGDEVLKILAERMRGCLKEPDAVARLAGDEFGALVALPAGVHPTVPGKWQTGFSTPFRNRLPSDRYASSLPPASGSHFPLATEATRRRWCRSPTAACTT